MTIEDVDASAEFDDDINTGTDKVFQNYLMPTLKLYDAKVSINHWQLRDCVKRSSTTPGKLYYVFDHTIRSLDTKSQQYGGAYGSKKHQKTRRQSLPQNALKSPAAGDEYHAPSKKVVEFAFKPRCFQENNGLIACGGLVGPDDNGSANNLSRYSLSVNDNDDSPLSPPRVEPVKLASSNILVDHSSYSNPLTWKGTLSLYNENNGVALTYRLGQYINNCVTLHQRSSQQYDLFTCNNDGHLYQCDVSDRGVELTRRLSDLKFALNNATISHDGKTMIVTGDSSKFALYHQNELDGSFSLQYDNQPSWGSSIVRAKRIPRFALPDRSGFIDHIYEAPSGDNGFYTSFSENDLQFSTVFQNGSCFVYDARKMETPLAEISSTRKHVQNGAFRVCKFSEGLDDLLFLSEHQGRVHVVDTRNFLNHQVIMIPDRVRLPGDEDAAAISASTSAIPRRNSMPLGDNDLCITTATNIPVKNLEPELLPFPKVVNCMGNNGSNDEIYASAYEEGAAQPLPAHRQRRRSSFRVRRFSTSAVSTSLDAIDPSILEHRYTEQNYHAVDNYNYLNNRNNRRQQGIESASNEERDNSSSAPLIEQPMDFVEAYNDINNDEVYPLGGGFRRHSRVIGTDSSDYLSYSRSNSYTRSNSNAIIDYTEENHISGIDWLQDEEGSSLVIGTDYGIMKWNINSWARRSFPSYDFC